MLTPAQIRAARALAGMTTAELADASGVDAADIYEAEIAKISPATADRLRLALEGKGIIFLGAGQQDGGGPGVRLRSSPDGEEGMRPEELDSSNDG